ncbi:ABC transporter ATP-binding protein [Vulgatibacter incomptus]|uniref:Oligopeptide transport ATP-binding protein OppF n=1 Tax=Vulgatibacter incomptus TaxID=1391653 RepID=A0A0K1PA92_9BACT|nr:oligopeptide/dipeptide ABC transporter ATP-binding protein [Vulgatibacter incomptus]AKU90435.1 Oligopeptide transport ATP-binding protein OppF [Vulgatibacter incomptus]
MLGGVKPLVRVDGLKVHFPVYKGSFFKRRSGAVRAVDGVSFEVRKGETLGLVGESGCGKSTTGRALMRLVEATAGSVELGGEDLLALQGEALRRRRRDFQMIFQDPYGSLNPRMTVLDIVAEPLRAHGLGGRGSELTARVQEILELCGLNARFIRRYPHEFSGGQRQRVAIARALALRPSFVVCDEPVSALDVSIRAQVLNLLVKLQRELSLTYLFIAHDLAAVRHLSDRIAVMYLGRIVELSPADEIYRRPAHPYTQALISAVPIPDPAAESQRQRIVLEGDVPSPLAPPSGCSFHPRCPTFKRLDSAQQARCRGEEPVLRVLGDGRHAACHFAA